MQKIALSTIAGVVLAISGATSSSAEKTNITIGGGPYLDVPQISQAMDKNLWKKHGITAKVTPFRTGRSAFEALIGGQLDFALMAEFPAVIGAMRGLKFGVLAEMSQYQAGRVNSNDKINLTSIKSLAGQKIGTTIGTNVHFMLDELLKKAGIKATIVNVRPPDIVPALVRGDVDAATMFPSFYGGAKRSLGKRYREFRINNYKTRFVFVGTAEMLDKNPNTVRSVLAALMEGEKLVKSDPADSQAAVDRVAKGKYKKAYIKSAWSSYRHRMVLDNDLLELMVREGKWIAARGSIKGVKSTKALYRPFLRGEFLKELGADRVDLK
ncbi:MAG: hypothetical protein GKS01_02135 [Alphaproteobacteria bacterium]|nr:hypothetical protein [Alphaproteobacteria bacterium]